MDNCQGNVRILGQSAEVLELLGGADLGDFDGVEGIKVRISALPVSLQRLSVQVSLAHCAGLIELATVSCASKGLHIGTPNFKF